MIFHFCSAVIMKHLTQKQLLIAVDQITARGFTYKRLFTLL